MEDTRGPLVISGFVVRTFLASVVAGIMATNKAGGDGSLALEDGVIVMGGDASAVAAISTVRDLLVRISPSHSIYFEVASSCFEAFHCAGGGYCD